MSAAFTLVVESVDSSRRGRASFSWSTGYVVGVTMLAGIHLAISAAAPSLPIAAWRAEELVFACVGVVFAAVVQALVLETPKFHLANGDRAEAVEAACRIAAWNGVEALEFDAAMAPLIASSAIQVAATDTAASVVAQAPTTVPATLLADSVGVVDDDDGDDDGGDRAAAWSDLFAPTGLLPLTLTLGGMQLAWNVAYYALAFSAG